MTPVEKLVYAAQLRLLLKGVSERALTEIQRYYLED